MRCVCNPTLQIGDFIQRVHVICAQGESVTLPFAATAAPLHPPVSAASAVDSGCISATWLSAFIKASQARLSAFEPVQLAHTANALAVIAKPHPSAYRIIDAAWQAAFVEAAGHHLSAGRFSLRNLVLVVTSLRVLRFKQAGQVQEFLADAETALAGMWAQEQQRQVLKELQAE